MHDRLSLICPSLFAVWSNLTLIVAVRSLLNSSTGLVVGLNLGPVVAFEFLRLGLESRGGGGGGGRGG